MASSTEYYRWYRNEKEKSDAYKKQISSLQKIRGTLLNDFYDEQSSVNKEIGELIEDLGKAVRNDTTFQITVSGYHSHKQLGVTSDSRLSCVNEALEGEIASLEAKKRIADEKRDSYYQAYRREKEEEWNRIWNH